jgi:NitT/TauT family transport system substrate-binding protein
MVVGMLGCGSSDQAATTTSADKVDVRVASLSGPTSIGLVSLMDKASNGQAANNYEFTISKAADEVTSKVINGDVDIACVPANVASVIWNKTNGAISVVDINTLGVLSVVTGDSSITSINSLAGHTVYMTGKGTTPEYVMNYLLDKNGIADQVDLEFKSDSTEVESILENDPNAIGVLPEPYVSVATTNNPSLSAAVSLTNEWSTASGGSSSLITGVTIVRNDFLNEHPDAVSQFVQEQSDSVDTVNSDPAAASQLVVNEGIIADASVAEKAIPNCNLVCMTGSDMYTSLQGYYKVLYSEDPSSIGGNLPSDNFYWFG